MSASPIVLARVLTERGELVLRRIGDDLQVISNGTFLMDTHGGHSERLLVDAALQRHAAPSDVLIGGLGVGFSVLAALADSRVNRVTVVEIEQALVDWHDSHLAAFTGGLLRDPRLEIVVADIATHLAAGASSYDVVCLDVDNGPDWTVTDANAALYDDAGSRLLVAALRPQGVLSVWSASSSPQYERRLRTVLDDLTVLEVARDRGEPDVIYVGRGRLLDPPGKRENSAIREP
jgi:spermidine synthase